MSNYMIDLIALWFVVASATLVGNLVAHRIAYRIRTVKSDEM